MSSDTAFLERLRAGVRSESSDETRQLGSELAGLLPADTVLALYGDLGTGKTTFISGLATGLGITRPVTSPTYNIYNLYRGTHQLIHLDAYRLEQSGDADGLMLEDLLESPWLLAVEWPERFEPYWLRKAWRLRFSFESDSVRTVRLESTEA
ncbi:MAG: tRNA (adenosine(37)-N6)-threonylcarbamoyltransferase complex ATPase subunit type 1 TsaE [Puniceicoccales bacterium]